MTQTLREMPDVDVRKKYAGLEQQRSAIQAECDAATDAILSERTAAHRKCYSEFQEKWHAEAKAFDDKINAIGNSFQDRFDTLDEQMAELGLGERAVDYAGDLVNCALTGLPIFEGDDVIGDVDDDIEVVLRDVLPLPPKTAAIDDAPDADDAGEQEEAAA